MKKQILALMLALALPLSGCASLLERSYTVVEPYTDRYWDTAQEDTLRVESYQDLVNSLLMLVEQRSEKIVIRYEGAVGLRAYYLAMAARREVMQETLLGSYLLRDITVTYADPADRSRLALALTYREEAEDPEKLMVLSDTQSLTDLLRISLREGHTTLTARFLEKTAHTDITAAVESLWQELQQEDALAQQNIADEAAGTDGNAPTPPEGSAGAAAVPSCPWTIRFYPHPDAAEIVEIQLGS